MKATGIVRRIDDLGRVVIPKEIRRTMRIREGEPLDNSLTLEEKFAIAIRSVVNRCKVIATIFSCKFAIDKKILLCYIEHNPDSDNYKRKCEKI